MMTHNKKISCSPFTTDKLPLIKEAITFESAQSSFYSALCYSITATCIRFSSLANKTYSESLKNSFSAIRQKCTNIAQQYSQQTEIAYFYNIIDFLHSNEHDVSFRLDYLDRYSENNTDSAYLQLGFKYILHSIFEGNDGIISSIWNNSYDIQIYSEILTRVSKSLLVKIVLLDYEEGLKEFLPQSPGTYPVIYLLVYSQHFSVLQTEPTEAFKQNVENFKHFLELEPNVAIVYPKPLEVAASPAANRNPNIPIPISQASAKPNNERYLIPIPVNRGFSPAQAKNLQADIIEILKSFSEEFMSLKIYNQNIINLMTNLMRKYKELDRLPVFSKFINFKPVPVHKAPNIPHHYAKPEDKAHVVDPLDFRNKIPELPNTPNYGQIKSSAFNGHNPLGYRLNSPVQPLHNIDRMNANRPNLIYDQSRKLN